MPLASAGILMYRRRDDEIEVLLVHPGGPFWRNKDDGAWSIPKGEMAADENAGAAARREFEEELGIVVTAPLVPLGEIKQRGGKRVLGFAVEDDLDVTAIRSNTFELEWPPKSGRIQAFPEVDRAAWLTFDAARRKILSGQRALLDRLADLVAQEP